MELKELIVGAQEAMDRGDFRLALTANTHALTAYPGCLAAHRMMGEAYLERGDQTSAVKHFERTLQIDPLNVVARLGLGVSSEETKDFSAAYAYYLHAWEINPALDQVRDELVRLRGLLDVDDRLHPTRAGLAGIHARAGQFRRAIGEWRAVLAVEPDSRRGRTALAELLWRSGDDSAATHAAREALRGCPDNARALAILADIERRRGSAGAEEIAQRYAHLDPTGEVIATIQPWRSDADLSFLQVDSAPLDDFDLDAHRSYDTGPLGSKKTVTASLAASQLAAPDLWDTLVKDLSTDIPSTNVAPTMASGVEPFNWNTNGVPGDIESAVAQPQAEADLEVEPSTDTSATIDESLDMDFSDVVPFELPAEDVAATEAAEPVGAETIIAVAASEESNVGTAAETFDDLVRSMATEDVVEPNAEAAAMPVGVAASTVHASVSGHAEVSYDIPISSTGASPVEHHESGLSIGAADVGGGVGGDVPAPASAPTNGQDFADPFVTEDGQIDLTRGWDDLDRALADATPSFEAEGGFDALLADLDGIQPFDADIEGADEDAWTPLFDDDLAAEPVAFAPSVDAPGPVDTDMSGSDDAADWYDDENSEADVLVLPTEDEIQGPAAIETYPSVLDEILESEEPKDATGELLDFADLEAFDVTPFVDEATPGPIEDEIVTGIPAPQPSGYTELLRNVDEETIATSAEAAAEVDPFAIPDGTGEPLEFDELLEVTSSDGTGPLAAEAVVDESDIDSHADNPLDFAATDLEAALPAAADVDFDLGLDGIVPFDSGAFLEASTADEPVEFGEIDQIAPTIEPDPVADLDVEPFAPDIRPFGYTDALSALDDEPFDFSDVVVEPVDETVAEDASVEVPSSDEDESAIEEAVAAGESLEPVGEFNPVDDDGDEAEAGSTSDVAAIQAVPEQPGWAGKDGLGTVAQKVLWPNFVNRTSELIDRALETDDLFERIAAQKKDLVAQGVVSASVALTSPAPVATEAPVADEEISQAADAEPSTPQMSEQTRLDLMAIRIRLIEDEDAAPEIAEVLERAIAEGLSAPLALRVLGEAYLKMGLVERAAAQFRQAMLARRRTNLESRER